jgi:branched-chain amino acid transport system substrate-binding protein
MLPRSQTKQAVAALIALVGLAALIPGFASAQSVSVKIAVAGSLTDFGASAGTPVLNAARLAAEEANADGGLHVELVVYDDHSTEDGAREVARKVASSDAIVVLGPDISIMCLAAGPLYTEAGLASVTPTANSDRVTTNATTFQTVISTSAMAASLANYLHHVIGGSRAVVIFKNDGYGQSFKTGFQQAAERLGIDVTYRSYAKPEDAQEVARELAGDATKPAVILGMIDSDAVPVLAAFKRQGISATVLGTSPMANDSFASLFANEPESRRDPGFFTDGLYAVSPSIPDSANAETLTFADRYRARYGEEPPWEAVQGYDTARLAIAAGRAALAQAGSSDLHKQREAVRSYLASIDSPAHAIASLTGPLWFTPERQRRQAARVGRFHDAVFESAPVQLVPVSVPDRREITSGALVEIGAGEFARRQQVVYAGVFTNEVARIDVAQSTFTADFYLWIRFARSAGAGAADPTEIDFPDLVRGTFDARRSATERDLDDGTTYRLWRVRGDFKNDFDLRRYPLDEQTLTVRFFNARAGSDRLVYVRDSRALSAGIESSPAVPTSASDGTTPVGKQLAAAAGQIGVVAASAFRNLTQWDLLQAGERRDVLVTASALGDPGLVGAERVRELAGFAVIFKVHRRSSRPWRRPCCRSD